MYGIVCGGSMDPHGRCTNSQKIANMAPVTGDLLARSDFPMYLVSSLGERHFLVAGGGGQAKTGVANAIVSRVDSF